MIAVPAMAAVAVVPAVHVMTGVRVMAAMVRVVIVTGMRVVRVMAAMARVVVVTGVRTVARLVIVTGSDIDVAMTGVVVVNGAGLRGPVPFIVSVHSATVYPLGVSRK